MPLYEYQCNACGHRFELIQKFSDKPVTKCPKCGKVGKVEKLLSSPAIQFKGTGWYITDYARKGMSSSESKAEGKDGKEKSDSKESAPASTETTAASKESSASATGSSRKSKKD